MKKKGKKTVFVGMSGGVDSSVAALLLKRQDYDVVGVFMRCFNIDGCAERDAEDARRVAERIGIPFYAWDFEEEYKKKVVDYMVRGYKAGLTPNPDVMCNREIKFGLFLERARALGADYVATGHYVRLRRTKIRNEKLGTKKKPHLSSLVSHLYSARDAQKDQSYFLWTLAQKDLTHCLFPIGELKKPEVRKIAARAGLPTAEKKDSQGICFLGQVTLADFLKEYLPERKGSVLNAAGKKIGTHLGAHFYTIGQRQGIGNIKHEKGNHLHVPVYVAKKNIRTNTVTVAEGADNPALFRKEVELCDVNLLAPRSQVLKNLRTQKGARVAARVRYRQPLSSAVLSIQKGEARLVFDRPQKFVAEGQSAVFYSTKGEMLGGGVIK